MSLWLFGSGLFMIDYGFYFAPCAIQGEMFQFCSRNNFDFGFAAAFRAEEKTVFICLHGILLNFKHARCVASRSLRRTIGETPRPFVIRAMEEGTGLEPVTGSLTGCCSTV